MATSYKNIVITPNIGNTADPKIQFSGGNTSANTDITLYVYPNSNGSLSFEGSAGQLFSITNDLTGSIFSVNDVSGIPSIDVNASGTVQLAPYSGNVGIGTTTPGAKFDMYKSSDGQIARFQGPTSYLYYAEYGGSSYLYNTGGNFYLGSLSNHNMTFVANNLGRMTVAASGDVRIGDGAVATNTLRYFDVYNTDNGASAGAIARLVTANAAGTGTTTVDLVKYKSGGFVINNNEPDTSAFTSFGVSGSERMRINGTGNITLSANLVLGTRGLSANGGFGTAGHVLHSNGSATYWAADDNSGGTVTSVAAGTGLSGGTITTTGTLSVNATYIGTLSANNTTYVNGKTEGNLNVNSATTATNSTQLGGVAAASYARKDIAETFAANVTAVAMYASNWFRSTGTSGWYSETYGGGIYMIATDQVRVYNNKQFWCGAFAGTTALSTATSQLQVQNGGGTGDNDVAAISFHCSGTFGLKMHLRADGYFGIGGWSANAWRWYVNTNNGDMTAAGNVTAYSDIRLKENITPLTNSLYKIKKLNGVRFTWKDLPDVVGNPGKADFGILAHEVEAVAPELISESPHKSPDGEPYKTVAYDKLVPLLIESIKELSAKVESLESQIEELKKK